MGRFARMFGYFRATIASIVYLAVLVGGALIRGAADPAQAAPGWGALRDIIVVGAKPNLLFVVDPAARKVLHRYGIPGDGPPNSISVSPDGRIAYVLTDHFNAISGINLDTGEQVFRAVLSTATERVRSIGGIAVSRDGKELFVQENATRILPSEYRVQPARIAIYGTSGGLDAKPLRTFATPRRLILMLPSVDGRLLYGLGWDLYAFNTRDGSLVSTTKVSHWDRPNASVPDVFAPLPLFEQSDVFSWPYYYTRTDKKPEEMGFANTGILTFDLRTGALDMRDFAGTVVPLISSVVDPTDHAKIYSVASTLNKIDLRKTQLEQSIDLPHTYYNVNVSSDGRYVYVAGGMNDIGVYSADNLRRVATIALTDSGDMALSSFRVVRRSPAP